MANLTYKSQNYEVQYQGSEAALLGMIFFIGSSYVVGKAIEASMRPAYLEAPAPKYYLNGQENRSLVDKEKQCSGRRDAKWNR